MSLLTANLGNSRISLAFFQGEKLLEHAAFALSSDLQVSISSFLGARKAKNAVLCSVNPPMEKALADSLRAVAGSVRCVGEDLPVPVVNLCREPQRVGRDRLVVAFEAWQRRKAACLVLDAGTAMTLNAISAKGEFLGGAIAPGFGLAARSLAQHTAQLPQVESFQSPSILGRTTEDAIAAGIAFGWAGMANAWIDAASRELGGTVRVLATGGDLDRLREVSGIDEFRPHLLHEGLARLAAGAGA